MNFNTKIRYIKNWQDCSTIKKATFPWLFCKKNTFPRAYPEWCYCICTIVDLVGWLVMAIFISLLHEYRFLIRGAEGKQKNLTLPKRLCKIWWRCFQWMSTFKLQISLCAATAQFPRDGRGVAQDSAEAKRYFIMAAERGNSEAMFQLGEMYHRKWEVQEPGSNWYQ